MKEFYKPYPKAKLFYDMEITIKHFSEISIFLNKNDAEPGN